MGLPWFRVHTVVLNDPGRLISVHIMHTGMSPILLKSAIHSGLYAKINSKIRLQNVYLIF